MRARDGRFDRSQPRKGPGRGALRVKPEKPGSERSDDSAQCDTVPHPAAAGLWEQFLARENLAEALRRVERNAGAAGIDGMSTKELRPWLRDHWLEVRSMLDAGTYRPSPVRRVMIPKPSGGRRMLGVPTVVDRLICQALSQVLTPVFDPHFHSHSFGFRPGRSAHQAVERARQFVADDDAGWCVEVDLDSFFDRVNHDALMARLARRAKDKQVLKLIRATQTNGGAPVLQLHDLQGNVIATAALSETETKPLTTYNSTEFGVPVNGSPPTKYSWIGSTGASSELSSGTLTVGTVSYQPQLGRRLQTATVIPPGMLVNGAEGEAYIVQGSAWSIQANEAQARIDEATIQAELQATAEKEAAEKACPIASMCVIPEEEMGELEGGEGDPEGLASYSTVKEIIEFLRKKANNSETLSELAKWLPGPITEAIGHGGPAIAATFRSYADALEANCIVYQKTHPWSACMVHYDSWTIKIGPVFWGVLYYVSAEYCERLTTTGVDDVYYCLGQKRNREGPWVKWKG